MFDVVCASLGAENGTAREGVSRRGESNTLKISQRESIIRLSRAIPHERS